MEGTTNSVRGKPCFKLLEFSYPQLNCGEELRTCGAFSDRRENRPFLTEFRAPLRPLIQEHQKFLVLSHRLLAFQPCDRPLVFIQRIVRYPSVAIRDDHDNDIALRNFL